MAQCKYCHETISRLDKDVCPFCGGLHPLDGTDTSTQDITKVIGQVGSDVQIKHKKKIVAALLALFLGIFGLNFFYLGRKKQGFVAILVAVVLIGGVGTGLFFLMENIFGFLIPYFVFEILMLIIGLGYLVRHDITDSLGEFLE